MNLSKIEIALLHVRGGPAQGAEEMKEQYQNSERDAVEYIISLYITAARDASADRLRSVFSDEASICGFLGPEKFAGPIEMLIAFVDGSEPSPNISEQVRSIYISEGIAVAVLDVQNWGGHSFEDILTFVKIGRDWKITSKVFRLVS